MSDNTNDRQIYTVSELNKIIKSLLNEHIGSVWVQGEISNFKSASSGHIYMTIKDENSQISVVVFKGMSRALKFQLENGMKVLLSGELTVYEKSGSYQIIANYIEPKGIGALQIAFEQLKEKLSKEGLFDNDRKKSLSFLPLRIGIVTSPVGAAIQDMLNISKRRCPIASIVVVPVKVQGDEAAQEIACAIDLLNKQECVDVIVIGRGGGSIEDLWAFNEEHLARAIVRSKIPVVSAVGHEVDFTISDFVSDLRAPTPSAAMELVLPDLIELRKRLLHFYKNIYNSFTGKLQYLKSRIQGLSSHYVFKESQGVVRSYVQRIDELDLGLRNYIQFYFKNMKSQFTGVVDHLNSLSPLKVFSRGYSVAVSVETNKILKSIKEVARKERLKTILKDGQVISEVINVIKENSKEPVPQAKLKVKEGQGLLF